VQAGDATGNEENARSGPFKLRQFEGRHSQEDERIGERRPFGAYRAADAAESLTVVALDQRDADQHEDEGASVPSSPSNNRTGPECRSDFR
jgi:hypothetical protein